MTLGVGGLSSDLSERMQPGETVPMPGARSKNAKRGPVAAVVLAAGSSRRMGSENKLLADLGGKPVIAHVVEAAIASAAEPVIVVTGYQAERVRWALARLDVQIVHNPHFPEGLSTSLHAGIAAVPMDAAGAVFCLGDMPLIMADVIDLLIRQFHTRHGESACVPTLRGRRGNPVVWPRAFFPEMLDLWGDAGARQLFARHAERIREVEIGAEGILVDVDTPETLHAIRETFE